MAFALFVVMENTFVHEGFVAGEAVQWLVLNTFLYWIVPVDSADCCLPAEQASLVPFTFKHFLDLVKNFFFEVD